MKFRNPLKKDLSAYSVDSFADRGDDGWVSRSRLGLRREFRNFVYTCMSIRAQEVAKIQFQFFATNPRVTQGDPMVDHPFLQLLEEPNEEQSQYELFELTQLDLDNYGLAYWTVVVDSRGVPVPPGVDGYGIYIVEPWRVKPKYDPKTGRLSYYEITRYDGTTVDMTLNEVVRFSYPRELGIVAANWIYVDTDNQTSVYQNAQMRNGASPGIAVSVKGSVTKDAFNKLKKQWKDLQQGAKNAGRTLFMRNTDYQVERITASIADLNMDVLKRISKDDVRQAFRIPKPKFGDTDGQGLGRDGAETVNYVFAADVTDGLQLRFDDALQRYVRRVYRQRIFVNHVNQIPENKAAKLAEHEAGWGKWLTSNEILKDSGREMVGPDGDVLLVPFNVVPLSQAVETVEPAPAQKSIRVVSRQLALPSPIQKSGQQQFLETQKTDRNVHANLYQKKLEALCKRQEEKVLAIFLSEVKSVADVEYIDTEKEAELFLAALMPIILEAVRQGGEAAFVYLGSPAIDFVLTEQVTARLTKVEARLLKSFNEQTAKKIQKTLTAGLQNGENVEQLTGRIKKVYGEIADYRAKAIAKSEANRAVAHGNIDAYRQLGVRQYKWWAQGESCPMCQALDGTIIDVGSSFVAKGSEIPGSDGQINDYEPIRGGDAHTNCVLGDTIVHSPNVKRITRAYYSGDIVKITTAKGSSLSVTPNHIVLTSRGWVCAKNLTKFDSIISYNFGQETSSKVNPTDDNCPATIEQIFASLSKSGSVTSVSVPASPEDFKGDGFSIQGNIDIVSADSFLSSNIDASLLESFKNLVFSESQLSGSFVKCSDLSSMLFALTLASDGIMSIDSLTSLFSCGHLTREQFVGLFNVSDYDLRVKKATADDISGDIEALSDAIRGFSSLISVDNVIDVKVENFSGHVYDLSTESTSYISNSIISSNCDCLVVPVLSKSASVEFPVVDDASLAEALNEL